MKYNLTENQKNLARLIATNIRNGRLDESFWVFDKGRAFMGRKNSRLTLSSPTSHAELKILQQNDLLSIDDHGPDWVCAARGSLFEAIDSNFRDEEGIRPVSELAQPHPPEISMSLDRLRERYPDPKKLGFLMMRFTAGKPFSKIVEVLQETGKKLGLDIVRADQHEFHADLWGNVRTYLHGCGFGVAVYERIETNEPNANIGLEVGYMLAMNKPVLLLKDKTLETTQSDLAGKLYRQFDPYDPEATLPPMLKKWLEDYGITVPAAPGTKP
ncbi:MAG TPA: hypothetical protein VN673_15285 [Clostridia bacterium]|nr:hypothetical protein [Clostridia bacterium]